MIWLRSEVEIRISTPNPTDQQILPLSPKTGVSINLIGSLPQRLHGSNTGNRELLPVELYITGIIQWHQLIVVREINYRESAPNGIVQVKTDMEHLRLSYCRRMDTNSGTRIGSG